MRMSVEEDNKILEFLHIFVDSRITVDMPEPTKSMVLHAFKKFRNKNQIYSLMTKYSKYYKSKF